MVRIFLVEMFAFDAIRITFESERTVLKCGTIVAAISE